MQEQEKPRRLPSRRDILYLLSVGLAGAAGGGLVEFFHHTTDAESEPQGYWENVRIDGTRLHAEINAYSLDSKAAIDHVDVVILDSAGDWRHLCRLPIAEKTNTYVCDEDISDFFTPGETVTVSFQVENTRGVVSYAPNGIKQIPTVSE